MSPSPLRTIKLGDLSSPILAAEYVRMSTDHQRYSTENQSAVIQSYATENNYKIVKTYRDEGKSGLNIDGREALQQLISDVQQKEIAFQVILVYDVSRWGRFQNADESAHYEYLCTRAGVKVIYCAEPFDNDGTPLATIYKGIKRSMAGEYSRELSAKVFAGQCRLVGLGFRQGGPPGVGLRRALLDEHGQRKGELKRGQRKSLQTDRVILVPGPDSEIQIIRDIYDQFIHGGLSERAIADDLNSRGILTDLNRPWSRGLVHQVLTNEKYIGNNVYNRTSAKLRQRIKVNSPDQWIRTERAFEGIVSITAFKRVREIILERSRRLDDAQMLELLRALLDRTGVLSGLLIDEQENMPSSSVYMHRFGGLIRAYSLIGYEPERDYRYLEVNRALRRWKPEAFQAVTRQLEEAGATVYRDENSDLLTINSEWTLSIAVSRCQTTKSGTLRWKVRFDASLEPDVTIAIRMRDDNQEPLDYYLIPRLDMCAWPKDLVEENPGLIDSYRFDSLSILDSLVKRHTIKELA